MIAMRTLCIMALGGLLTACSATLLEDIGDVGEISAPRLCTEPTKLFNTFTMHARRIAWKGDRGDPKATVTLELVFDNDKSFPIALSNSGNGVLYTMQFSLQGEKGGSHAPKEASGILLMREPKKFTEPPRPGPFGPATPPPKPTVQIDDTRDVNFRIRPGEPEAGRLVFQAPRDNYLLTIERKFSGRPVTGQPTDHVSVCRIFASDAAAKPAEMPATSGTR